MVFIDNKYTRIYYAIINNAKSRTLPDNIYTERHHIIPRSFFKEQSPTGWLPGDANAKKNTVVLTAKEHFICHRLLVKMIDGIGYFKMSNAMMRLANSQDNRYQVNSFTYAYIKKTWSEAKKGRPCSAETKEKIRQGNLKRKPCSDETRRKLSEAAKRRKGFTPEGRAKSIEANLGRKHSDEAKEKIRQHNLGKTNWKQKGVPQEKLTCPYCGLVGGKSAMKHWHFEKCRHK